MNIAIDIDDTLADSFDHFIPYLAEFYHADAEEMRRNNISYSTLPKEWRKDIKTFGRTYYDTITPTTPFKPDAAWGVKTLHERGHRIVIITGRTTTVYTDPYKTTKGQLARGGIIYDKLICTMQKAEACLEEKIDLLIDDLPANCDAAAAQGIDTLLFSSKGNRALSSSHRRVENWKETVELVIQLEQARTATKF